MLIAVLAAVSGWHIGYAAVLPQTIAALAAALAVDAAVVLYRQKKLVWSDPAAITGLIVAGVAAPRTSWFMAAALAAIAVASKYLIRADRRNIFNPAAIALLIGTVLLGVRLSWWIDSTHWLTVIAGSVLLAKFAGRWRLVITFLAAYAGLLAAFAWRTGEPLVDVWFMYTNIASFFVFFMATDPKTSPIMTKHLPAFAAIAAAGSLASVIWHPASLFLGGLLLANAATPLFNRTVLKKLPQAAAGAAGQPATPPNRTAAGPGAAS